MDTGGWRCKRLPEVKDCCIRLVKDYGEDYEDHDEKTMPEDCRPPLYDSRISHSIGQEEAHRAR